jgi:polyribonucleotide nucleotidyltransferase
MLSDIPLPTPVGAVRIGKVDGNFVVNPKEEDLTTSVVGGTPGEEGEEEGRSDLDLVVAGTEDAILMVEAGANEIPEAEILDALDIAHAEIKKICALQRELAEKAGKEKKPIVTVPVDEALLQQIRSSHGAQLDAATQVEDKLERQEATKAAEAAVLEHYAPASPEGASDEQVAAAKLRRTEVQLAFDKLEKSIIRERIAVHKKRPDGRSENEIREITIEVGVTPRTHGSALFTRGQTQALSVAALGTLKEEMRLDTLGLETKKYYWHHYNFPPFSVGEAGRMGGVKRRDIGHGALAERALAPMVPSIEEFPYSIRVVSDILESNGSSSMASVCGSSLALMDAGVPIKRPVAGIAMGLIKEGDEYVVLTDIAGVEDHLGDMDFKVAGTERGITALQMDIKISGVTFDILRDALTRAHDARTFILGKMSEVIGSPREQLSQFAPRIQTIQIDPSQIGLLIGKGGETIRGLSEEFESQIDVNDDGQVLVYSANGDLGDALVERVRMMMKEVEVGDEYVGKVVKTTTFGAFVELAKGTDGLLHISNVSPGQRVESVEDVLNKGDEINVRVVEVDRERGRIGLRLTDDPDIAGKSVEELAGVGTGGGGRPRDGGGGRNGRERSGGGDRSERRPRRDGERGSGRPRHGRD